MLKPCGYKPNGPPYGEIAAARVSQSEVNTAVECLKFALLVYDKEMGKLPILAAAAVRHPL